MNDELVQKRAKANRAKKLDEKGRKKRPMPKSGRALKGAPPRPK